MMYDANLGQRRVITAAILIFMIGLTSSCSLINPSSDGEIYFYSLGMGADDGASYFTLDYRDDGFTFIMSRGLGGQKLTENEAIDLIDETDFTLKLDGSLLSPDSDMTVKKLGFLGLDGWHVVQNFSVPVEDIGRGLYELYGKTDLIREGAVRENTVNLTIR